MAGQAADPFHHLHDEGYASAYEGGFVGADSYVAPAGRRLESLDGSWAFTLDPFEEGLRQRWFALDETPSSQWAVPRDYDLAGAEPVPVPSCWNVLRPEWLHYEGAAWYARHLDFTPGEPGERVLLHVGAAAYAALVFLNGTFAGAHRGGSTPFCIDLTGLLRPGRNRLQIMVENTRRAARVPMHHVDWFNYGGLYREIGLLRLPPVFIRRADWRLAAEGAGIEVRIRLAEPVSGTARVQVPALGVDAACAVAAGVGRLVVPARPALWSPDRPVLYDVSVSFGADEVRDRVGFRSLAVRGREILLNGEPVYLKGVCVHEDDLALGKCTNEADIRRRFADARALGCNFLRLAHYPHHELAARIADEEGLLLWSEIPVYWAIDFADPAAFADAANQLRELIARDTNRASVILWGVGNENADTDARLSFMSRLAAIAREEDGSRLVTAACLINRERFAIEDRLAAHLDVIGLNEYFGWYEPDFSGLDRLLAHSDPDRPVIVSETGADAVPGLAGAGRRLFSEDWQAEFYRQQIGRLAASPYVQGIAAWLLYDFRSLRRQTGHQRGFNRKGLIAEDKRTRKAAFAVLAGLYAGLP